MKKHVGKLVSLVLAIAMVLTMAVGMTAMADDTLPTKQLSVATDDTHSYEVYQIFTGKYDETANNLAAVKWGINGTGTTGEAVPENVLTALQDVNKAEKTNAEKLGVIKQYVTLDAKKKFGTVSAGSPLPVPTGYYLLKDIDNSLEKKDDAYTTFITMVVGDTTITRKAAKPTDTKDVQDETTDAEAGADSEGYGKSADHAINESFNFKLTATIPADSDIKDYQTYPITFTDTMSKGITFEAIDSVKVNDTKLTADQYTLSENAIAGLKGPATWTLKTADLKGIVNTLGTTETTVTVIYKAHLNEEAKVNDASGSTTNTNKSHITYNNNPNGEGTGETPDKEVYVFTFKITNKKVIDKTDGDPLKDAGFKLYESDGSTEIGLIYDDTVSAYRPVKGEEKAVEMKSADDGSFNITGLDAGTYVLKETTVPNGYNQAEDTQIKISATHKDNSVTLSEDSTMDNQIVDKKGSTLPSTGGIGTTIFYVVGIILVLGAAIVLVSRRKNNAQ